MKLFPCTVLALLIAGCAGRPSSVDTFGPTLSQRREHRDPFERDEITVSPPKPQTTETAGVEEQPTRTRFGDDTLNQIDFRGAALSEALHLLAQQAGVNIYLDTGLDRTVDASFPAVTLDDALDVLLQRNGLQMSESPPGVFWIENRDGSQVETASFRLASIEVADVLENLQGLVSEDSRLVADTTQNFVLVRGPRTEIDAVAAFIEGADRLKTQVLIEVEILEVILDDGFEFGVQALLNDPNFLGEAAIDTVSDLLTNDLSFSSLISFNDADIDLTINALESYGLVNVISSPRVLAIDNTESSINVVREIPYIQATTEITSSAGDVGTSSQQEVQFKEAGITLTVTPAVQRDGVVQLSLENTLSEVIDEFLGIPVLDSRRINSTFLVGESQTVVIGGLVQTRSEERDNGVPFLMHIPFLGRLFRNDADTTNRRELVVMITPRVLALDQADEYARKYRANYEQRLESQGVPRK